MAIDGFLELLRDDGEKVAGESLDRKFGKEHAIAILSFEMKSTSSDRKKKKKDAKGKGGKKGSDTDDDDFDDDDVGSAKGKRTCPISFKISKEVDSSSPYLYLSYCTHSDAEDSNDKPFKIARVTLRKAEGGQALEFLVLEFEQAFVTSYKVGTDESKMPTESLSFTCKACKIKYRPQRMGGSNRDNIAGWDFINGKPL